MKTEKEVNERIKKIRTFLEIGEEVTLNFGKKKELLKEIIVLEWVLGKRRVMNLREKHKISIAPLQDELLINLEDGEKGSSELALMVNRKVVGIRTALKSLEKKGLIENVGSPRNNLWRAK